MSGNRGTGQTAWKVLGITVLVSGFLFVFLGWQWWTLAGAFILTAWIDFRKGTSVAYFGFMTALVLSVVAGIVAAVYLLLHVNLS